MPTDNTNYTCTTEEDPVNIMMSLDDFKDALQALNLAIEDIDTEMIYRKLQIIGCRDSGSRMGLSDEEERKIEKDAKYASLRYRKTKLSNQKLFLLTTGMLPEDWDLW